MHHNHTQPTPDAAAPVRRWAAYALSAVVPCAAHCTPCDTRQHCADVAELDAWMRAHEHEGPGGYRMQLHTEQPPTAPQAPRARP